MATTSTRTLEETSSPVLKLRSSYKRPDLDGIHARNGADISSGFASFQDGFTNVLPPQYAEIKRRLAKNPEAVKESWFRLKKRLAERIEQLEAQGNSFIPSVPYSELQNLAPAKREELLDKGCVVIKNVFSREEGQKFKADVIEYIKNNPQTVGFPEAAKVVYELYWSKSQTKARSDPRMRATLQFMNELWHASDDTEVVLSQNVMYADRLRIRNAGDHLFALGPHADGGGIERWEDDEYSACYTPIWEGRWEEYDPWDATHRVDAVMAKHAAAGNCTVFRTFQGWLAMSDIAPKEGTIYLAPFIKETSAYYLLRPFFNDKDELDLDSSVFPGTSIGKTQEFNDNTHPSLQLEKLMTPVPNVGPGDAVFWHCDMIHAVDPVHHGDHDSSVMYIPSVPLCDLNARYSLIQRESVLRGLPPPDFPGFPTGLGETTHVGKADVDDVRRFGGDGALREYALLPFETREEYSEGGKKIVEKCNSILFE